MQEAKEWRQLEAQKIKTGSRITVARIRASSLGFPYGASDFARSGMIALKGSPLKAEGNCVAYAGPEGSRTTA